MSANPLTELPPVDVEGHVPSGLGSPSHPMRVMTRRAAGLDSGGWDDEAKAQVASYFDELAPDWHTRSSPQRTLVVVDALTRGDVTGEIALEIGSGTGTYSALLAERFATVLAVDLAAEMLRLAPRQPAHRVLADGADLPVQTGATDAVVLVNAFLFPAEVARVLRPGGLLVWVNSSGDETPIHLRSDEVVDALPGTWTGVASRAGAGTWCVLRRSLS